MLRLVGCILLHLHFFKKYAYAAAVGVEDKRRFNFGCGCGCGFKQLKIFEIDRPIFANKNLKPFSMDYIVYKRFNYLSGNLGITIAP